MYKTISVNLTRTHVIRDNDNPTKEGVGLKGRCVWLKLNPVTDLQVGLVGDLIRF